MAILVTRSISKLVKFSGVLFLCDTRCSGVNVLTKFGCCRFGFVFLFVKTLNFVIHLVCSVQFCLCKSYIGWLYLDFWVSFFLDEHNLAMYMLALGVSWWIYRTTVYQKPSFP
jgi:hypothetical protein